MSIVKFSDEIYMRNLIIFLAGITILSSSLFAIEAGETTPATPDKILGSGRLSSEEMALFLVTENQYVDYDFAGEFAELYIKEAAAEGVNHDVAFSQMCVETNFLNFDKAVTMDTNNFGGIGAAGKERPGESFSSILLGVRAQIQHLKAYATSSPLVQECVDPRYFNVRYGSAPTVYELSGRWSVDTAYGEKLKTAMQDIYLMAFTTGASGKLITAAPNTFFLPLTQKRLGGL
ncbi:lipoprotein [Spirochaetia bacterium]|nr:lipoprotein [Spirochaetia bacterium]